ncbi:hypothetical protein [Pectinatus sottacetonis]|uniref:hypothetical protein n=1 Tax=Pectinatus sottacetonis TaxID=1002795 RepID=UPI0018C4E5B1|nr:hypothetical protein [Pectinatus sottacetonis]
MLKEKELEVNNLKELEKVDLTKIYCNPKRLFSKGKNGKINNTLEKSLLKTNLLAATAKNINAVIKANNVYNAGLASAGDQFLLQIATNNNTKLSVQTSFDNNVTYVTTVFFVENNIATVVTQSQNLLGNYDITSFLPKGGVYYIQIRILSGSGNFKFVVPEILKYSNSEPIDNLYQAINLVPSEI